MMTYDKSAWVVHKFGGTSVANAERYRAAAEIVLTSGERVAVIVSAMSGVTNELIRAVGLAAKHDSSYLAYLAQLSPSSNSSRRKPSRSVKPSRRISLRSKKCCAAFG